MNPTIQSALADHERCAAALAQQQGLLVRIARRTSRAFRAGKRLYLAGNGGSAADAQHVAAELVGRLRRERAALPAVALTTDTSALTAVANDYGYERVFARQIEAHVRRGDVVWLFSTSGRSANILAAAAVARRLGAIVVGFTGSDGGALKPLCEHCLSVPHESSDRIQEIHQVAYHILCDLIEQAMTPKPTPARRARRCARRTEIDRAARPTGTVRRRR